MINNDPPTTYHLLDHADSHEVLPQAENTKQELALPSTQFFNDNPEFDPEILIMQLTND